ncbi:spermidine/putrescine ABC transporter permease PotC [Psittacicella melopsittaci]|uniref:Spermidine/putrescine transport system permease protein PotC n=1 Tax=Psittacicella melopsittaci TaxID=2028576 RepID=A0A3A1Y2A6_9GAMM|nr:spermidine/putrescine ABC transporter permease PotC [Psittacicella melopsittaci]RIY31695.1 spermidine/putrescine ABC transporter permease PotC [Psittacicella melopsittaci]
MIKRIAITFIIALVVLFMYLPIAVLVVNSFNANRYGIRWDGFTWRWYEKLFNNQDMINAALHSLTIGFLAATLVTIIGALVSIAVYRYKFKGKGAVQGLLLLNMITPDVVMAIALLILFVTLGFSLGFTTLLIAHITFCLPYAVIVISSRLQGFDRRILEAAKDLGAPESVILLKIILPLIFPAIAASWLLCFIISMDDVIISSFTTGPGYEPLPVRVFSLVKSGVTPDVNSVATIMVLVSIIIVTLVSFAFRGKLKFNF